MVSQHILFSNSFRATEPDDLVAMQLEEWDPVIKWFNERCVLTHSRLYVQ